MENNKVHPVATNAPSKVSDPLFRKVRNFGANQAAKGKGRTGQQFLKHLSSAVIEAHFPTPETDLPERNFGNFSPFLKW